jgi:hypothetical protein
MVIVLIEFIIVIVVIVIVVIAQAARDSVSRRETSLGTTQNTTLHPRSGISLHLISLSPHLTSPHDLAYTTRNNRRHPR